MLQIIMDSTSTYFWESFHSIFIGATDYNMKALARNLQLQEVPNLQSFADSASPFIRAAMYDLLITLGLATEG